MCIRDSTIPVQRKMLCVQRDIWLGNGNWRFMGSNHEAQRDESQSISDRKRASPNDWANRAFSAAFFRQALARTAHVPMGNTKSNIKLSTEASDPSVRTDVARSPLGTPHHSSPENALLAWDLCPLYGTENRITAARICLRWLPHSDTIGFLRIKPVTTIVRNCARSGKVDRCKRSVDPSALCSITGSLAFKLCQWPTGYIC